MKLKAYWAMNWAMSFRHSAQCRPPMPLAARRCDFRHQRRRSAAFPVSLADLAEGVINSAFSRSQESDADDFLRSAEKRDKHPWLSVTQHSIPATMDGVMQKSLTDSPPGSADRAQHMRDRIAEDKSKSLSSFGLVSRRPAIIAQLFRI